MFLNANFEKLKIKDLEEIRFRIIETETNIKIIIKEEIGIDCKLELQEMKKTLKNK